jgi:hypothetical protein
MDKSSSEKIGTVVLKPEHKEVIDRLIACENDHVGWQTVGFESNVIISKKVEQGSCIMPLRLHAVLPEISFNVLCDMIVNLDVRKQWDHLEGFEIVDQFGINEDLVYTFTKVRLSLTGRMRLV